MNIEVEVLSHRVQYFHQEYKKHKLHGKSQQNDAQVVELKKLGFGQLEETSSPEESSSKHMPQTDVDEFMVG